MGIEDVIQIRDPILKLGFTIIPNCILDDSNLLPQEKVLYGLLLRYAWQQKHCHPAQMTLANAMGCSVRQVQRGLQKLRRHGLIGWERKGLMMPNIYWIMPLQNRYHDVVALQDANGDDTDVTSVATPMSDKEYPSEEDSSLPSILPGKRKNGKITPCPEFTNVTMTQKDYDILVEKFGAVGTKDRIEGLSLYKRNSDKKYKDDQAVILTWERRDKKERSERHGAHRGHSKEDTTEDLESSVGVAID